MTVGDGADMGHNEYFIAHKVVTRVSNNSLSRQQNKGLLKSSSIDGPELCSSHSQSVDEVG